MVTAERQEQLVRTGDYVRVAATRQPEKRMMRAVHPSLIPINDGSSAKLTVKISVPVSVTYAEPEGEAQQRRNRKRESQRQQINRRR